MKASRSLRLALYSIPLVLVLAVPLVATVVAAEESLEDFVFRVPVSVENQSGAPLENTPVCVAANAPSLISDGFLQPDLGDLRPTNADSEAAPLLAQDIADAEPCWWLTIDALPDGQTRNWYLHMGNATATRDQGIFLQGTPTGTGTSDERITVPHDESLNITNNLVVESLGTTLYDIPTAESWLVRKEGQYALGVRNGNEVFGLLNDGLDYVLDATENNNRAKDINANVTLVPGASPTFEQAASFAASGAELRVAPATAINDIWTTPTAGATVQFWLWLPSDTPASTVLITKGGWSIRVSGSPGNNRVMELLYECSGGTYRGFTTSAVVSEETWQHWSVARISASCTSIGTNIYRNGAPQSGNGDFTTGSYVGDSGSSLRIGHAFGGIIDDLRLWNDDQSGTTIGNNWDIQLNGDETDLVGYWKMNDLYSSEVSYSPITLGESADYALTYASPSLDLWLDGVIVASATATGDIATTSNDVVIGGGWTGQVEQTRVGELFTPYALPELAALYRSDVGVIMDGVGVATWTDDSGNGNHMAQTDSDKQPTVTGDVFGVRDGITFDGSNDVLEAVTGAYLNGSSGAIVGVIQPRMGGNTRQAILGSGGSGNDTRYFLVSPQMTNTDTYISVQQRDQDTLDLIHGNTLVPHNHNVLLTWRSDGSAYIHRVNGQEQSVTVVIGSNDGDWFADTTARDNVTLGSVLRSDQITPAASILGIIILLEPDPGAATVELIEGWADAWQAESLILNDLLLATVTLDLTYAPLSVSQSTAGDDANGWTWTGTVADQSGEGNDATYTFGRDLTGITVEVLSVQTKAVLPDPVISADLADMVGNLPSLIGREAMINFWGREEATAAIAAAGVDPDAAWFALAAIAAIFLGGGTALATGQPWMALMVAALPIGFGGPAGLYSWWAAVIGAFACVGVGGTLAFMGVRR